MSPKVNIELSREILFGALTQEIWPILCGTGATSARILRSIFFTILHTNYTPMITFLLVHKALSPPQIDYYFF